MRFILVTADKLYKFNYIKENINNYNQIYDFIIINTSEGIGSVSIGIDVSCVTILTNSILTRIEQKRRKPNLYIIYLIV